MNKESEGTMNTQPKALLLADELSKSHISDYINHFAAVELRRLHFENLEQARLLGMSAEREVALIAKIEEHAEKLKYDIHSCGPTCERYVCVAIRNAVAEEREACAQVVNDDRGLSDDDCIRVMRAIRARVNK